MEIRREIVIWLVAIGCVLVVSVILAAAYPLESYAIRELAIRSVAYFMAAALLTGVVHWISVPLGRTKTRLSALVIGRTAGLAACGMSFLFLISDLHDATNFLEGAVIFAGVSFSCHRTCHRLRA